LSRYSIFPLRSDYSLFREKIPFNMRLELHILNFNLICKVNKYLCCIKNCSQKSGRMLKVEVMILLFLVLLCCHAQETVIPCGRNIYDERNLDVPENLLGKHPWAASYGLLEGARWKHQVSISSTFFVQLLLVRSSKAYKRQWSCQSFYAFGNYVCKSCA